MALMFRDSPRTYGDRWLLHGRSGSKNAWVELHWPGRDADAPFDLPDGRDMAAVIEGGDLDRVPREAWLQVEHRGALGDLVWTTSHTFTVASERFVQTLRDHGVTCFRTLPLPLRHADGQTCTGYSIILVDGADADPIREFPPGRRAINGIDVSEEIVRLLRANAVTDLSMSRPLHLMTLMPHDTVER